MDFRIIIRALAIQAAEGMTQNRGGDRFGQISWE